LVLVRLQQQEQLELVRQRGLVLLEELQELHRVQRRHRSKQQRQERRSLERQCSKLELHCSRSRLGHSNLLNCRNDGDVDVVHSSCWQRVHSNECGERDSEERGHSSHSTDHCRQQLELEHRQQPLERCMRELNNHRSFCDGRTRSHSWCQRLTG